LQSLWHNPALQASFSCLKIVDQDPLIRWQRPAIWW
jgi:hypothetical protein